MYTRQNNCNGGPQSTQALVYKKYVILLSKYETSWGWSSDFGEGCCCRKEDALRAAQLNIEQILLRKAQR
ncbi:MAG: hypothetical protein QNJ54_07350 [Prochloraceae cyanobacterium]|nr:hypothetical protein [Prochloraceae cyanobacterium]